MCNVVSRLKECYHEIVYNCEEINHNFIVQSKATIQKTIGVVYNVNLSMYNVVS